MVIEMACAAVLAVNDFKPEWVKIVAYLVAVPFIGLIGYTAYYEAKHADRKGTR